MSAVLNFRRNQMPERSPHATFRAAAEEAVRITEDGFGAVESIEVAGVTVWSQNSPVSRKLYNLAVMVGRIKA
jgi:hypothetical protein